MWEYIRVKPFPLYHEVRFKVWCCVIYTHAILPHLYHFHVFFFPQGGYVCVNSGISTTHQFTHLALQSVHQSLSPADANQLWQTKTTTFFSFWLLVPPSPSLSFSLSASLPLVSCCSSTVIVCQRVTLKRLLYFYLTVFLTAGISFLNYTIKMELRAG